MVVMADLGIAGIGDATLIASGGSALVYGALTDEGEAVAVKVLRGMRGSEVARRFKREHTAAERLQEHPNIIDIYGGGVTGSGEPYLVLPLFAGGSLQDELDESGPFPLGRAVSDVMTAGHAIEFAHTRGVLHRDIKPGNLLRTTEGSVVVTDFGIARVKDAGITSATIGATTPLYAAPELLAENEASVQSEVYALGALLYALLAGKPAFSDSPNIWATMNRIRVETAPWIEGVPAPIMRVIDQAMAKDPRARPASSGLFGAYLTEALDADVDWTPPKTAPTTEPLPAPGPAFIPVVPSSASPPLPRSGQAPPIPGFDRPLEPVGHEPRQPSGALRAGAALAAVVLVAALGWWGVDRILGERTANTDTAGRGPIDSSLPQREPSSTQPEVTPEPTPTPTTRLVSFTGDHFTAYLPEGWSVLSRDVDVGYGYRSRFVADDMYLTVDTTPDYLESGGEEIEMSARDVADGIASASAVRSEEVDGLMLHSFTFRNNQGVDSIDIFFEVDGDGYAIVAGSNSDPIGAFAVARQVALTVRGTPPL